MQPTFAKRLARSAGLSALFVAIYGGCNWFTARRADVGSIEFAWERHLPFVPLLIVPYMSIDLFFVTAPFLCRTERELSIFTRRVASAIVAAGVCFLVFPLRFVFPRPHASGWTGALFDWFRGIDLPYNQFPSLHIALCILVADVFVRHTSGALRLALIAWFTLIAASAVLTYQHHLLDVVGGFALAAACIYFVPQPAARDHVSARMREPVF